jgi:hypothetical protein
MQKLRKRVSILTTVSSCRYDAVPCAFEFSCGLEVEHVADGDEDLLGLYWDRHSLFCYEI